MTDWRDVIQPERIMRSPQVDGAVYGCELCGIAEATHPREVHGLGHFSTTEGVPLGFVMPSPTLVVRRIAARRSRDLAIAEVDESSGRARTDMVRAQCPCGADAVCTPQRVEGARCSACALIDAGERVARPDYDMRGRND